MAQLGRDFGWLQEFLLVQKRMGPLSSGLLACELPGGMPQLCKHSIPHEFHQGKELC